MLRLSTIILILCGLSAFSAQGQSTMPSSREPGTGPIYYAPRHTSLKKIRKPKVTHTARYEFYERVEQAAREKQKILKRLSKEQFSDPRHFGHKRIPKRHAPSKMRYCNECGLRH